MSKRFFFLIITIFLGTTAKTVLADSIITAIPPKLQIEASPGEIIKTSIKVRNDSETSQIYSINVNDFIVDSESGTPIPISENITSKWSLRKWISAPNSIPVDSKGTQIIPLTIRIPSSALPGGHYSMVTYMPNTDVKPGQLKKTATIIGQRVGTLIYVTIKGKVNEKANITSFNLPKFSEQGPINISGTVENLSDIHIEPKGFVVISDMLNREVAKLPVNVGNIFPDSSKKFLLNWDQKWGYGKYKSELNLLYGNNNVLTATVFFWLFPIRLVIYSLIIIISILTTSILLAKRKKRHQDQLELEVQELQKEIEKLHKP